MSTGWNEETIRKAADWRAFKAGAALYNQGAVTRAEATTTGWRGSVRDGRRALSVSVVARGPDDVETRCSCPGNRTTGQFCAHAVAAGLVVSRSAAAPPPAPLRQATPPASAAAPACITLFDILVPPSWQNLLASGRLPARIVSASADAGRAPDPADTALAAWLAASGAPAGGMLHLRGDSLESFLAAIPGHRAMRPDTPDAHALNVTLDEPVPLASAERRGERVHLVPEPGDAAVRLGRSAVRIHEHTIELRLQPLPAPLAPLAEGKPVDLDLAAMLDLADAIGASLRLPADGWLAGLRFVPADFAARLTLSASGTRIIAKPAVQYAGAPPLPPGSPARVPGLPSLDGDLCRVRNHSGERAIIRLLERHGFAPPADASAEWSLTGESRIADFLDDGLPRLRSHLEIVHGPGFAHLSRKFETIEPQFHVVASGEDWLVMDLSFQTSDSNTSIPPREAWQMLQGQSRGSHGARPSPAISQLLQPLLEELEVEQESGRYRFKSASAECARMFSDFVRKGHNSNAFDSLTFEKPETIQAKLRPYQQHGAAWIIDRLEKHRGALLADDMGLGKTLQTIVSIERLFQQGDEPDGSILVVCPTSLLGNWRAEFGRFAPTRVVRVLHGTGRDRVKAECAPGEVWITSFGTLARDLAWFLRRRFLAVVVDEASQMRNPDTDHAKALCKLDSRFRLALTGTPVENGVRDLWSIFHFIQPGWLGGRRTFQERYESPLAGGDPWTLRRLRLKTAPFILRRTKDEVAADLPAKLHIDEFCDLSPDQQGVYRELLVQGRRSVDELTGPAQSGAARMRVLTTLLRLRQTCCDLALLQNERLNDLPIPRRSAKIERLLEILESAVESNHKILVFSQFRSQLLKIRECLEARQIESLQLDGGTRDRQQLVDHFQSSEGPPVFLISLKAGGYGLNLTAADVVVHFDPWWNPAAEAQATDRAHRIGQTRPVTVYRLLARGTVEEKVVALQRKKRAAAAAVDGLDEDGASGIPAGWSDEEMRALLQ